MAQLEALLDDVALALLCGDLAAVADLTPRIESAELAAPDRIAAQRLRAKAERNARLLEAASRGVAAARFRLAEITRGPTLTTYDMRGRKASIAPLGAEPARRV